MLWTDFNWLGDLFQLKAAFKHKCKNGFPFSWCEKPRKYNLELVTEIGTDQIFKHLEISSNELSWLLFFRWCAAWGLLLQAGCYFLIASGSTLRCPNRVWREKFHFPYVLSFLSSVLVCWYYVVSVNWCVNYVNNLNSYSSEAGIKKFFRCSS